MFQANYKIFLISNNIYVDKISTHTIQIRQLKLTDHAYVI